METMLTMYKDIGIVAIVAVPLFLLIKWITEEFKATLLRQHEERKEWATIISGFQNCLGEHTENAKAFHDEVKEALRYQRQEHKEHTELIQKVLIMIIVVYAFQKISLIILE